MTQARRALGAYGEGRVARWYEANGYVVVERNWRCKQGEIDLIVLRGSDIIFCEVKTRSSAAFGIPAESVTTAKQTRLRRLAAAYLSEKRPGALNVRFDVGCVIGNQVDVIEGAF